MDRRQFDMRCTAAKLLFRSLILFEKCMRAWFIANDLRLVFSQKLLHSILISPTSLASMFPDL